MTVKDLLDQIVAVSADDSGAFRTNALRWLNLTRSYISSKGTWRSAMVADATLTTAAATTDGLYVLEGYEHLVNDYLYDETSDATIQHESFATMNGIDPGKETTGTPAWWGDAGVDTNDNRQIYLWPIPDAAYTIRYAGYKVLSDLSSTDESLSIDPFYGAISPWAAALTQGLRWYYDQDNNEDANIIFAGKRMLDNMIRDRKNEQRISRSAGLKLGNIKTSKPGVIGRFPPANFNNRG